MDVYLWKDGNTVIRHIDLTVAAERNGFTQPPDKTITDEEFYAAGCLVRVIDGEIFLGKTEKEKADELAREEIIEIDTQFAEIERKMIRPMLAHINGTKTQYDIDRLNELTEKADTLRAKRKQKEDSLEEESVIVYNS
jgi:hypothetical protein